MTKRTRRWLILALVAILPLVAIGRRAAHRLLPTSTTKEVYDDDEAPREQVQEINGVVKVIPWEQVPQSQRFLFQMNNDDTYKYRVPIVRVIESTNAGGSSVTRIGLNPNHTEVSCSWGERH